MLNRRTVITPAPQLRDLATEPTTTIQPIRLMEASHDRRGTASRWSTLSRSTTHSVVYRDLTLGELQDSGVWRRALERAERRAMEPWRNVADDDHKSRQSSIWMV